MPIGGGSFLRAASIAARKVSEVRSSAVPRSAQRRTKYPYTIGNAWSYSASSARAASLGSANALTLLSSRWRRKLRRANEKNYSPASLFPGDRRTVWRAHAQQPVIPTGPAAGTDRELDRSLRRSTIWFPH